MGLIVINAVSRLLQTRSHAVRDTQCSEYWQQKLRMKMAALLGNKWTFLTRSPRAAPHWTEGSGTRRLLQWSAFEPLFWGAFSINVPKWNLKGYYFHYFPLSQYSSCLNVSCK